MNEIYGREVCEVSVKDQYYNMYDIIKDNMECVNVAKAAMKKAVEVIVTIVNIEK